MSTPDQEALGLFLTDAAEAIRNIEESLLILESGPGQQEELNLLYRGMHTLKGNAAFLELHAVETLAHACEDLVSLPRDHGVPFDRTMISLLLEALDRLRWAVHVLSVERRTPPLEAVTALVERITAAFVDRGGVKHEQLTRAAGWGRCQPGARRRRSPRDRRRTRWCRRTRPRRRATRAGRRPWIRRTSLRSVANRVRQAMREELPPRRRRESPPRGGGTRATPVGGVHGRRTRVRRGVPRWDAEASGWSRGAGGSLSRE
jgi:HPt (histidine-containing phosphotransfer) domain-containing protein